VSAGDAIGRASGSPRGRTCQARRRAGNRRNRAATRSGRSLCESVNGGDDADQEIESDPIAGLHARVDGFASLAVLFDALGIWIGYPLADPIVGLLITILILRIVWESGKAVFTRVLDGVDPEVIHEIKHAAIHVAGVGDVTELRVRWLGHRLYAELNIAVHQDLSVEKGHAIAKDVRHELLHHLRYLSNATIHIDPANASGEEHHRIDEHSHDDLPSHSH